MSHINTYICTYDYNVQKINNIKQIYLLFESIMLNYYKVYYKICKL